MIDVPQEVPQEVVIQAVVVNTDGESVTTAYTGVDGGFYTTQLPIDIIPADDPTGPEAEAFLATFVVEG